MCILTVLGGKPFSISCEKLERSLVFFEPRVENHKFISFKGVFIIFSRVVIRWPLLLLKYSKSPRLSRMIKIRIYDRSDQGSIPKVYSLRLSFDPLFCFDYI